LPKLKFIKDHLCSSCELGKAKRKSFQSKLTPSLKRRLHLLHMDLCGPMRVASINGKRYVLVIVDDYSRYTWTRFLRSKNETPEVLIDFLRLVQRGLQAQVRVVRTDKGTEFLNQTLHAYFATEGIQHQTSVARTPEQNGAEAVATACFTQNRSLVIPRHEKTPYHIINDRKPSVKFFHIFGSVCYIVRDGENIDKIKEKGDVCIFVGYSTQSRAYRVFNKRIRVIMESIHVNFDELPQMASAHNSSDPASTCQTMASDQISSDPAPECQTMAVEHDSLSPGQKCQENVSHGDKTGTTSNEMDLLFSPMFDELLNGSSNVVSKSSAVSAADAPNQRQQISTPLNNHTTTAPTLIVDDYSRYTWTYFLRSKDETPKVLIDFLRLVQRGLQAQVRVVQTDKGTKFFNQTLHAYFAAEGILHQTYIARTPKQNGVVERRNRTLVEAARTMLSAVKVPLFFWDEAIATACFTKNRSLVIPRHEKTPYRTSTTRNRQLSSFTFFALYATLSEMGKILTK
nr:hypothetical protein [Tanacetum cinerariifolium]